MPSACFGAISNVPLLLIQRKNTGGLKQKHKKQLAFGEKNR